MASGTPVQNTIADKAGVSLTPLAVPALKEDIKFTIPQPSDPDGPRLTMYSYRPEWPREGNRQRIVAPVAASRAAAVKIAKEGFPSLEDIPDKQIRFCIRPESDLDKMGPYLYIVDDAWAAMAASTTRHIYVVIEETPEVVRQRKAQQTQTNRTIIAGLILIAGVLWALVYICSD